MISTTWGLLGPERLAPERRSRSLGLTSVVRTFNDLAVPGLGNVFFGKQLFLALLGIAVASRAREQGARKVSNIETANAIEALACWIGLEKIDWQLDARLRGRIKLDRSYGQTFPFSVLKRPSYYVSHPMRQATSSALVDLKLVESTGSLFNSFECSEIGMHFLELVIERKLPGRVTFIDYLANWVLGGNSRSSVIDDVLSPVDEMPPVACNYLRSLLRAILVDVDHGGLENYAKYVEEQAERLKRPQITAYRTFSKELPDPYDPLERCYVSYSERKKFADEWWTARDEGYNTALAKDWWLNDAILDGTNLWHRWEMTYLRSADREAMRTAELNQLVKKK